MTWSKDGGGEEQRHGQKEETMRKQDAKGQNREMEERRKAISGYGSSRKDIGL